MGELHLDVLVDRMKREFKVEATVGKPQVSYRETIRQKVESVDYTHKKQTGGSGRSLRLSSPLNLWYREGEVYEFKNVTGGRILANTSHQLTRVFRSHAVRCSCWLPTVGVKATLKTAPTRR